MPLFSCPLVAKDWQKNYLRAWMFLNSKQRVNYVSNFDFWPIVQKNFLGRNFAQAQPLLDLPWKKCHIRSQLLIFYLHFYFYSISTLLPLVKIRIKWLIVTINHKHECNSKSNQPQNVQPFKLMKQSLYVLVYLAILVRVSPRRGKVYTSPSFLTVLVFLSINISTRPGSRFMLPATFKGTVLREEYVFKKKSALFVVRWRCL